MEPDRKILQEKVNSYSNKLLAHDQRQSNFYAVLQEAVHNSDEYSTVMRAFGLYPIAVIPVAVVTHMGFDEMAALNSINTTACLTLCKNYGKADD